MCQKCVKVCHGVYGWFSANSRREVAKQRRKTTYSIRPNRRDKNTFLENVPSRHAAKNRLIYLIIGAKGPENVSPSVKMCHFGFWPAGKQGPAGGVPRRAHPKGSDHSPMLLPPSKTPKTLPMAANGCQKRVGGVAGAERNSKK